MKQIVTLACAIMLALGAHAQITLTQTNFSSWTPGTDSFRSFTSPVVSPAINGTWDMSTATYAGTAFSIPKTPYSGSGVPGATYTTFSGYGFSALYYYVNLCYGINSQGISRLGETIGRQAYSIEPATMNTQDSVIFPAQNVVYSGPKKNLAFPATMSSHWTSDFTYNTNFELIATAYGLNRVPGYRRTHVTQKDSVVGWGKIRVKNLAGVTSGWADVLAVKSVEDIVDSFYLNGAPAPTVLLSSLGLSQGMQDHVYRISYYRAGEAESMMLAEYGDASFSAIQNADVHISRLPLAATAVQGINQVADAFRLYPNPAASSEALNLEMTETAPGIWSYKMLNAGGQVVRQEQLNMNGGKAKVALQHLIPGTYFLSVSRDGRPVSAKPLVIKN